VDNASIQNVIVVSNLINVNYVDILSLKDYYHYVFVLMDIMMLLRIIVVYYVLLNVLHVIMGKIVFLAEIQLLKELFPIVFVLRDILMMECKINANYVKKVVKLVKME